MGLRGRPWTALALAMVPGLVGLRFAWSGVADWMPECSIRRLTGLHCPGCGGTRCAGRLLEGDLAGAFAMNAAVAVIALSAAGLLLAGVWREWRGGKSTLRILPAWAWSLAAFVLVFGLVRNLPWWPFTLLVPP